MHSEMLPTAHALYSNQVPTLSNGCRSWQEEFSKTSPGMQKYVKSLEEAFEQQMRASTASANPPAATNFRNSGTQSTSGNTSTQEPISNIDALAAPTKNRKEKRTRGGHAHVFSVFLVLTCSYRFHFSNSEVGSLECLLV
jgi:hypothetical protein